ncbi:hypothetical protein SCUP234_11156 [Seiridium cupressi]
MYSWSLRCTTIDPLPSSAINRESRDVVRRIRQRGKPINIATDVLDDLIIMKYIDDPTLTPYDYQSALPLDHQEFMETVKPNQMDWDLDVLFINLSNEDENFSLISGLAWTRGIETLSIQCSRNLSSREVVTFDQLCVWACRNGAPTYPETSEMTVADAVVGKLRNFHSISELQLVSTPRAEIARRGKNLDRDNNGFVLVGFLGMATADALVDLRADERDPFVRLFKYFDDGLRLKKLDERIMLRAGANLDRISPLEVGRDHPDNVVYVDSTDDEADA